MAQAGRVLVVEDYGVGRMLGELQDGLRLGRYRPAPVWRVEIPKSEGGRRPLGIPSARDRVAQQAVKLVLEPVSRRIFCRSRTGFGRNGRPRRRWSGCVPGSSRAAKGWISSAVVHSAHVGPVVGTEAGHPLLPAPLAVAAGDETAAGQDPARTGRNRVGRDIREVIAEVNPVLRGWGNYFRTGNAAIKFRQVDNYVVMRLRSLTVEERGLQPARGTGPAVDGGLVQRAWPVSIARHHPLSEGGVTMSRRSSVSGMRETHTYGLKGGWGSGLARAPRP
ncbi:group II intron maturase [Nonomuraea polychroma]|uniref:Group II intron maturase n=1 Tax=Nonomuraea polychroma TaxID=46176 RepID=A0A438M6K0_9ACTN|nr:group II intron maturase [Nonomuraea polychroma]